MNIITIFHPLNLVTENFLYQGGYRMAVGRYADRPITAAAANILNRINKAQRHLMQALPFGKRNFRVFITFFKIRINLFPLNRI